MKSKENKNYFFGRSTTLMLFHWKGDKWSILWYSVLYRSWSKISIITYNLSVSFFVYEIKAILPWCLSCGNFNTHLSLNMYCHLKYWHSCLICFYDQVVEFIKNKKTRSDFEDFNFSFTCKLFESDLFIVEWSKEYEQEARFQPKAGR